MSLFAGIYSLNRKCSIRSDDKNQILDFMSQKKVQVDMAEDDGFLLVKADVGAFNDRAFIDSYDGYLAALAGDPIFSPPDNVNKSRVDVLKEIVSKVFEEKSKVLGKCQGMYSLCVYDSRTRNLLLSVDKLGVRPVYFYQNEEYLFFSGSLGLLESLSHVEKQMDLVAITERLILNSFLGRRTPYADIHVLRGGECLETQGNELKIISYFTWDGIGVSNKRKDELLNEVYDSFNRALEVRFWRDDRIIGFLSGGMDSRAVVTSLNGMGKELYCGNLSFPGSQDDVYPREYANQLGLKYYRYNRSVDDKFKSNKFQTMMNRMIEEIEKSDKNPPRFPRLVFSGEGGSVGFGHVYMDKNKVERMRERDINGAINLYMENKHFPTKLLNQKSFSSVKDTIYSDIYNELTIPNHEDPGRNYFIFLLNNDQRCHLYEHYEDILDHKIEILSPFYDGELLSLIISVPLDWCLLHEFYTDLFNKFPDVINSVPWQTYPGHIPCPVTETRKLAYQWSENEGNPKFYSKEHFNLCRRDVLSRKFASGILDRRYLLAALFLHGIGVKNFSSEFRFVSAFQKYFSMCNGNIG